jgi:hypothetical protein
MKPITTIAVAMLSILPASAFAQGAAENDFAGHGIFFTVSGGVVAAPSFLGSGETSIYAFPNVSVAVGDRLNISLLEGVSYDFYKDDNLTAGAVLTYDFGRNDTPSNHELLLSNVAESEIAGLGDIEETAEIGGYIEYTYGNMQAKLSASKGVDGGHDGIVGDVEVIYNAPVEIFGKHWIYDFNTYRIFCDQKSNREPQRFLELRKVLDNANLSANVACVQALPSKEVTLIQLTDLLLGAASSRMNKTLGEGTAKETVVKALEQRLSIPSLRPTYQSEPKFNIFKINLGGGW